MIDLSLGTVTAVNRTLGTVDAQLRSGLMLYGVKYLTSPPWKGLDANFAEVASGSWVCVGLIGDQGGYGPNLCSNGEFEQDTSGWDNTASTAFNFDGTTNGWVALASTTIALETTIVYNGSGSLNVTATAATTVGATSPTGAAGITNIVAGTQYILTAWVRNNPSTNARVAQARIKWYTAAGAYISDSAFGATVTTDPATFGPVGCTATAPATSGLAAIEIQFVSAATGDVFYIDTAVLTGGASATLARDTVNFYAGLASLSVTSTGAGVCYAQTPSPATDPLRGIPVNPGDVYYIDCRFRQSNGLQLFIVAAWVFADGSVVADFDYNSRSVAGSTSFLYHTQTFLAPSNAVAVHFAFAFLATAGAQVLNLDSVKIRQALINPGAGVQSVLPDNFSWGISGATQQPGTLLWIPQEADHPRAVVNGYVQSRAMRARLFRKSGAQGITSNGAWTIVSFSNLESNGLFASTAANFISLPRNGVYRVSGQVQWAPIVGAAAAGWRAMRIERWSADGTTLLEVLCATGEDDEAATDDTLAQNVGIDAPVNRDERIMLTVAASHGSTVINLDPTTGATAPQVLAVTYIGDA